VELGPTIGNELGGHGVEHHVPPLVIKSPRSEELTR
jgi:hypothetical protein